MKAHTQEERVDPGRVVAHLGAGIPASGGGDRPDSAPAGERLRYLGLAFAAADVLLEIGPDGAIAFAAGATARLFGTASARDLQARRLSDLLVKEDGELLATILPTFSSGERLGPLRVTVASPSGTGGVAVHLSLIRLPARPAVVSCAIGLASGMPLTQVRRNAQGMIDGDVFGGLAEAALQDASSAQTPIRLDLLELPGLDRLLTEAPEQRAAELRGRLAAALRAESLEGVGGAALTANRFALLRSDGASVQGLVTRVKDALGAELETRTAAIVLGGPTVTQELLGLRYALDRFIEAGPAAAEAGFAASLSRTAAQVEGFRSMLAKGNFRLVYQPVVDLASNVTHHFEALARFEGVASPAETIMMAEQLELIADFDLAVFQRAARTLRKMRTKVAVNVSAVSLGQPGFVEALLAEVGGDRDLSSRLLIELTETRALNDLDAARSQLCSLRAAGHVVCLDDFGAGAAGLEYLRHLDVEFVKLDAQYVRSAESNPREAAIVAHVGALCRQLGVSTIAEAIETPATAAFIFGLGVQLGQGWHFGRPAAQPTPISSLIADCG